MRKKKLPQLFFGKIIVELMAPAIKKTGTFNLFIIIYGKICFRKLDNAISLKQKKKFFLPFLDTKPLIAMKILGHHDKQLTPSESWYQDGFF